MLAPVVAAAARADSAAALEVDDLVAQALQLMAAGQKGEARHCQGNGGAQGWHRTTPRCFISTFFCDRGEAQEV